MKHRVLVAEAGDPDALASERIGTLPDFDRPWEDRQKVEVEVDDGDSLGSLLRRAGEELDRIGPERAEAEPWTPTYFGIEVEGQRAQMWSELTFLDNERRIRWNYRWQDEPYSELLRAVEGGALPGDPSRLYFIRMGGVGDGFVSGFPEFIHLSHIWWEVLKTTYDVGGVLLTANTLLDMFEEDDQASNVVEKMAEDWKGNGGQPFKIRELVVRREGSKPADLAGFLGISEEEARALLVWFGSKEDDDGRWRVGEDQGSQLMAKMVEFMLWAGRLPDDAFRQEAQKFADEFAKSGRAPDVDWKYVSELPLDPKWSANLQSPHQEDRGPRARIRRWFRERR